MDEARAQKTDVVWAAVYLSIVASVGLALLFAFADGTGLDTAIAIDLVLAWTLAVVAVVLLLLAPGAARGLLVAGRVIVGLACLLLLVAAGLGVLSIAGVG